MKSKKENKKIKEKLIYMHHPGHYRFGYVPMFFINNYVNGCIVSTIGEFVEDIGINGRHIEVEDPIWYTEIYKMISDKKITDFLSSELYKKLDFNKIRIDYPFYETVVLEAKKSNYKCCPYIMKYPLYIKWFSYDNINDAIRNHNFLCEKISRNKNFLIEK